MTYRKERKFVSGRLWAHAKWRDLSCTWGSQTFYGSSCRRSGRDFQEEKMAIQKVGVAGCGLMGSGIAQVCAASGFATVVREVSGELLDKGLKSIDKNLNRLAEEGTITEAGKGGNQRGVKGTTVLEKLKKFYVIIQATRQTVS